MKKVTIFVSIFILSLFSSLLFAGGGIAHMFIAEKAIDRLPDAELRSILRNNLDDYLVGAYYPDSGYVLGNQYGEDTHWDPFIYTFADYIKERYIDPGSQNPKLVAFLFGCASHRVSDEIMHFQFYREMKSRDFHGDTEEAHSYGDLGVDLLLIIEQNRWQNFPTVWRIPTNDLVQVYRRMGKDQYTAEQIMRGNRLISIAGFGERLIAIPAYLYLQWKMPWTAGHYYSSKQGGILVQEEQVAAYQMRLWQRIKDKTNPPMPFKTKLNAYTKHTGETPTLDFARMALDTGAVDVGTEQNQDGSVEIQQPIIANAKKLQALVSKFIASIKG